MIRKLLCCLMALCLLIPCAMAEEEDDLSIEELLQGVEGATIYDDGTIVTDADEVDALLEETSIYEADGSILITITATGDFTIGGDSRKRSNIFDKELEKHEDIHFTMAGVKDIL